MQLLIENDRKSTGSLRIFYTIFVHVTIITVIWEVRKKIIIIYVNGLCDIASKQLFKISASIVNARNKNIEFHTN